MSDGAFPRRIWRRSLAVLGSVGITGLLVSGGTLADSYRIRPVIGLSSGNLIELARLAEPVAITADWASKGSIRQIVDEYCGKQPEKFTQYLLSEAKRINLQQDLDAHVEPGAVVYVPFCLKTERDKPVKVASGETPGHILLREYGVAGPVTTRHFFERNRDRMRATSVEGFSQSLQVGQELLVPFASEPRVLTERPVSVGGLAMLIDDLPGDTVGAPLRGTVEEIPREEARRPDEFSYVETVTFEDTDDIADCETDGRPGIPVANLDSLKAVYARETAAMISGGEKRHKTVIGIIDSGIASTDSDSFPDKVFAKNLDELHGERKADDDDPPNGYKDDIYGINFNKDNGFVLFYPTDPRHQHGTQMATLLLGGPAVASRWTMVPDPPLVRLKVVNFSSSETGKPVHPSLLSSAIEYLRVAGADVINLSLSNRQMILGFDNALRRSMTRQLLFVVAAGNAKSGRGANLDFGVPLVFPARYGGRGDFHRNFVTVGAHDINGKLARFSNYSSQYVDILAPGCSIETLGTDGAPTHIHGTSPATAITSFATGLVRALGERDANNIKNRLLASVDVDEDLKYAVWSSGRLNIIKAISLRHDVIEPISNTGGYTFGKLQDRANLFRFCGDAGFRKILHKHTKRLAKVRPNIRASSSEAVEYWFEVDNSLERLSCPQVGADLSIGKISVASVMMAGPRLRDVKDIVLSSKRSN